jgi:putative transposase
MVASAFQKRFSTRSVAFVRAVFIEAVLRHGEHLGRKLGRTLGRFRDVVALDATVVRLHRLLATSFPATRTNHTEAAAKLHVVYSLARQVVTRLAITAERVGDRACAPIGEWMRGHLVLFDLGYYQYGLFQRIAQRRAFFVSRLRENANPLIVAVRRGIARGCRAKGSYLWDVDFADGRPVDLDVEIGRGDARGILRLVGRYNVDENCWHLYLTNLPPRSFTPNEVAELYRLRWEVELLFKELKSTCRLEDIPSSREDVVLTLLYASMLALIAARALAFRVQSAAEPDASGLSLRIVTKYLAQIALPLASVLLKGGRTVEHYLRQLAIDIGTVCRDPTPSRPSVLRRLGG